MFARIRFYLMPQPPAQRGREPVRTPYLEDPKAVLREDAWVVRRWPFGMVGIYGDKKSVVHTPSLRPLGRRSCAGQRSAQRKEYQHLTMFGLRDSCVITPHHSSVSTVSEQPRRVECIATPPSFVHPLPPSSMGL